MTQERKKKLIVSIIVFGISMVTYLLTVAPTVSFWDCGEFIACSNILGIPHPPGTPFFMVLGRAFIILLSFFSDIGFRVNLVSVLGSALGVTFSFLFTQKLLKLIFKLKKDNFITYTGGLVAALLVNFSDTYWFNAVEAEVYGIAMFLVMFISWLSLKWVENRETGAGDRILLLICYLAFLGVGFHLYTLMTVPAILVFMLMVEPKVRTNIPLLITGTALMTLVMWAGPWLFIAGAVLAANTVGFFIAENPVWRKNWSLSMWLCIFALLGYSTHAYIPIRSALNPRIDENNPETWEAYKGFVERKQYGSEGMLRRAMHRRGDVFNQIFSHPHMGYGGYMLAQYLPWKVGEGRSSIADGKYKGTPRFELDENENFPVQRLGMRFPTQMTFMPPYTKRGMQVVFFILFHIPFIWGGWQAYKHNKPYGLYILLLYVLSSAGLIFYMNFSDGLRPDLAPYNQWIQQGADPSTPPSNVYMEVRERDYFYAPGYMFMSILFGVSAGFLLFNLARRKKGGGSLVKTVGIALLTLAFVVPSFSNYHEHNRARLFVPYDYARNLLESCRPNGILFTNGDNDTFPLWFMQEVENVRRDVRIINLSLANTDWYVHQLIDQEPKVILGFTHPQIDGLRPTINSLKSPTDHKLGKTGLTVTLQDEKNKPYYKIQDILVMNIVQNNYPERPIHFAVTVSNPNMMGLDKYMIMEGMVYTLTNEIHNQSIEPQRTAYLADSVYWYRGLGNSNTYLNGDTRGLLSNYFATHHRLARWAQEKIVSLDKEAEKLRQAQDTLTSDSLKAQYKKELAGIEKQREEKVAFAENYIRKNGEMMPWDWRHYYFGSQFYRAMSQFDKAEEMLKQGFRLNKQTMAMTVQLGQIYMEQNKMEEAEKLYQQLNEKFPGNFQTTYALAEIYDKQNKYPEAKSVLSDWLQENNSHQYAGFIRQKIQEYDKKLSPAAPPSKLQPLEAVVPSKKGSSAVQGQKTADSAK